MSDHELKQLIQAADRAITAQDVDRLMDFYADDATLVVKPGLNATGKAEIRKAFVAIATHFKKQLKVRQGEMKVIEGGETALVIMETVLDTLDAEGAECGGLPMSFEMRVPAGFVSSTIPTARRCLPGKSQHEAEASLS
ncbi:nuclear transport factor 2 family protein [Ensifer adhaerens]|uniref:YybH family protein n=1 Tax=Ensifer adhaerens TaxID=106592 RepID=UPI0023A91791|nr:nuclear transport factor 2 family protein [Ensifer adhaerens]WDZ78363.1 nuclear transport factor 2 family protein [Ensifer adhaerens]